MNKILSLFYTIIISCIGVGGLLCIALIAFSSDYANAPCKNPNRHDVIDSAAQADSVCAHFKRLSDSINKSRKKKNK
jgi:hypothetical protein